MGAHHVNTTPIVIAAVDNSAAARAVIATAVAVAPVLGATVDVIHISPLKAGRRTNGETARRCAASFDVPYRTMTGDAFDELVQLTNGDDVVALVVGARGL